MFYLVALFVNPNDERHRPLIVIVLERPDAGLAWGWWRENHLAKHS